MNAIVERDLAIYDAAVECIRAHFGSHEKMAQHYVTTTGRDVAGTTVWRWCSERGLPIRVVVVLVEGSHVAMKDRRELIRALVPELLDYLK